MSTFLGEQRGERTIPTWATGALAIVTAAVAVGCGGAAPPSQGPPTGPTERPIASPPPAVSTTPSVPTATAPTVTQPGPDGAEATYPKVKLALHVAADGQLSELDQFDNTVAIWVPTGWHLFAGQALAVQRSGVIDAMPRTKVMPMSFGEPKMYGTWPNDAWVSGTRLVDRSGQPEIMRYTPAGWKRVHMVRFGWFFAGVGRWSKGRMLALEYNGGYYREKPTARFRVLSGPQGGPLPQVTSPPKPAAPIDEDGDGVADPHEQPRPWIVVPNHMVPTVTGHVFVFGARQDDRGGDWVEWWRPGTRNSTIEELPYGPDKKHSGQPPFMTAGTRGDDLYVAEYSRLVHFDGQAWSPVSLPRPDRVLRHMSLSEQGTLWVVQDSKAKGGPTEVFRKAKQGTWEQLEFDKPVKAAQVLARTDQDVWVMGELKGSDFTTVLHTSAPPVKPPRFVVTGESDEKVRQRPGVSLRLPKPATPRCERLFAVFYGITKYAAPGYDFPLTRKALKGRTEFAKARFVKTEERGQQYFGAFIRNYRRAGELIEVIEKSVPNSKPQLLCHTPKVLEELQIDLATGNANGWKPFVPPQGWTEYAKPE